MRLPVEQDCKKRVGSNPTSPSIIGEMKEPRANSKKYKRACKIVLLGATIGLAGTLSCAIIYSSLLTFPYQKSFDLQSLGDPLFPRGKGYLLIHELTNVSRQYYYLKYFSFFAFLGAFTTAAGDYALSDRKNIWSKLFFAALIGIELFLVLKSLLHQ